MLAHVERHPPGEVVLPALLAQLIADFRSAFGRRTTLTAVFREVCGPLLETAEARKVREAQEARERRKREVRAVSVLYEAEKARERRKAGEASPEPV